MKCQICDKEVLNFKSLSSHLRYNHKQYSSKQYYDLFLKKDNKEGNCYLKNCLNQTKYIGIHGYNRFCCFSHAQLDESTQNKIEQTNLKNTGFKYISQDPKIKKKKELTNLKNCGETTNLKCQATKDKIIQTNRQTRNYDYIMQDPEIQKKKELTWINHSFEQNKKINEKRKQTWLEHSSGQMEEINEKRKDTYKEKTGYDHPMQNPEVVKKVIINIRKTRIQKGHWLPDDQIPYLQLYQRKVNYYTYQSIHTKFTKEELLKRKLSGVSDGIHVDHRYSIKQGFVDGILPWIIGSTCNLEMIPWKENIKKKHKCSISKEELFLLYEQEKITEPLFLQIE